MAMSLLIPKIEQANGINMSEPPAIPEVPQAHRTEAMHINRAEAISTSMPKVRTAPMVMMTMVTAAPDILMVQPKGMEIA